jgi:hypothetical protein
MSEVAWYWMGQSARLLLKDHGPYDSEKLASESLVELKENPMYWFFDTCVVRKVSY